MTLEILKTVISGLVFFNHFFFCILWVDILLRNQTSLGKFDIFASRIKDILTTFGFMLILTFCFTRFYFMLFWYEYTFEDHENATGCGTLYICLFETIRRGWMNGGGVADDMNHQLYAFVPPTTDKELMNE